MSHIKPIKKMLINATQREEFRVAVIEGKELCNLESETMDPEQSKGPKKGDIICAIVERTEPSLEAAFLNAGSMRHAFLPIKEIHKDFLKIDPNNPKARPHIRDVKPGQRILVQVEKEERGNKGAFLTSFISLAGPYLVLMPNKSKAGGVSRRVEGGERDELKNAIGELNVPEGMSVIVRTAGVGRSPEELQWDLDVLLTQWRAIEEASRQQRSGPFLIYQESDIIIRALRDNLRPDISEILVDTPEALEHAKNHIAHMRPDFVNRIKLYSDSVPLFTQYQIEEQIEFAHCRKVKLENGGEIVINITEALTAVDVNSSKATEGSNIEETALNTNLAAAKEIARQLRLRDLGGLIVIDFIDMSSNKNQRAVEDKLREELKKDRARTRMRPLSSFGLLEMSRQRLRPSLGDATQINCPRCDGQGTIRTIPSTALALLRVIEEEGLKENIAQLRIHVPVDVATFLFNEKRDALLALEKRHNIRVLILPNAEFSTPHYEITRLRKDEGGANEPSYQLSKKLNKPEENTYYHKKHVYEQPAIKQLPQTAAPYHTGPTASSIIRRIWTAIFGAPAPIAPLVEQPKATPQRQHSNRSDSSGRGNSRNRRSENNPNSNRREPREARDSRETREPREQREPREAREPRVSREAKDDQQNHNASKNNKRRNNRSQNRNNKPQEGQTQHHTAQEEAAQHTHMSSTSTPPVDIEQPKVESKPAKPARQPKPRPPTRPLRQSAAHPDNIKQAALNRDSVEAPSCAALEPKSSASTADSTEHKTRKNKTGFIKSENDEANFITDSGDNSGFSSRTSKPLKQVQSKSGSSPIELKPKPVVISEEFITNDFDKDSK